MNALWLSLAALGGVGLGFALAWRAKAAGPQAGATPTATPALDPPDRRPELARQLESLRVSLECRSRPPADPFDPRALAGYIIELSDAARAQTCSGVADVIRMRVDRLSKAAERTRASDSAQAFVEVADHVNELVLLLEQQLKTSLRPK